MSNLQTFKNNEQKVRKINKKEIDFLFLSEVTAREERSLILLTEELKRRGYSAEYLLCGEWGNHKYRKHINVLIVNSCFDRTALEHTVYTVAGKAKKIAALRWEQIPINAPDYSYEYDRIIATTKTINTFAWGEHYCDCMRKCGVQEKYIHKTGPISMDFLRPEFQKTFNSKEYIMNRFNLPKKKILLFISDFSLMELDKKVYEFSVELYGAQNFERMINYEIKLQETVLEWFERLLSEKGNDWIIVYRPHPGVQEGRKALELSKRLNGFYYISEFSAQQWIKIADEVATVASTMIADAYFSDKNIIVIRPFEVPSEMDNPLYDEVGYIETYDALKNALEDNEYSINAKNIKEYYDVTDQASYIRIANALELIYHNKIYNTKWDEADLAFVKRYRIIRRLSILDKIIVEDIKKIVKRVLRILHRTYEPKSSFLKDWIMKAENIVKHDENFRKDMENILKEINR